MAARFTVERILRDPDDASGQTIRRWHIQKEGDHLTIKSTENADGFILIRAEDVARLADDLKTAAALGD